MSAAGATDTNTGAATAGSATTTESGGGAQQAAWYASRNDAEFTGYLQNRGWDKKAPDEVAYEASKAHRAAEKMIGAPADQMLRLPKDQTDSEGWNKVYERLGRPSKPDEYDFKDVKFGDGTDLDDGFRDFLRDAAFATNMSKDGAGAFARKTVAYLDKIDSVDSAEKQATLKAEREALDKSWGANKDANNFIVEQTFKKLTDAAKMSPEQATNALKVLGETIGRPAVAQFLLATGIAMGEDKFIANKSAVNGVMTKEAAKARMAENRGDKDWVRRFNQGDKETIREFNALTEMMVGRAA